MTSYIVTQTLYLSLDQFTSVQTYLKTCQNSSGLTIVLRLEMYFVFNNAVLVQHIILMFHMENKARILTAVQLLTNLYLAASSFIACTVRRMWTSFYPSFRQSHHSLSFLSNTSIYPRFPSYNKNIISADFCYSHLKYFSAFQSKEAC
jgi:hypothetical protein